MNESLGITVHNTCYECMVIERDKQDGFPASQCQTCIDSAEAKAANAAWNLHEEDRLGESPAMSYDTSAEPTASEWVTSQTYIRPRGWIVKMTEVWSDECKLVELSVKFLETDEALIRHEFLPPIVQFVDGGVYEELWELEDYTQAKRETECRWCHILTPKIFNDCQACDKPLENNLI